MLLRNRFEPYPVTGWGQVFQPFLKTSNLKNLNFIIKADSALVDDRDTRGPLIYEAMTQLNHSTNKK